MTDGRLVRISKLMSLILRHEPGKFGITLDAEGYAAMSELLGAIREQIADAAESDLIAVVETIEPDKRRFAISEGEIRANYGHSLTDRIVHERAMPPAVLWHGTAAPAVAAIRRDGIRPMKRQYVHLTTHTALASRIGARHGTAVLIEVDAAQAHADGIAFYRANEAFWLADAIPAKYVKDADRI